MKTSKFILYVSAAAAVGAVIYKALQPKKLERQEFEGRRHKNRHLSPVFSKINQTLQSETE